MKVVILAGGLGTRLSEETASRPKPMVEMQMYPDGVQRTDEAVRRFQAAGYDAIVFMSGEYTHMPDSLVEYLFRDYDVYSNGVLALHVSKRAGTGFSVPPGYPLLPPA